MPLRYKVNILQELKRVGYNSNCIRKEKLIREDILQHFRTGYTVSKTYET